MSAKRRKIVNTELDNLIANLRGEVGEIITAWVIMRQFMAQGAHLSSGDPAKDLNSREYGMVVVLVDKLRDDLSGRLSELAERRVGRLTFHFAAQKLREFGAEVDGFERFVVKQSTRRKRNRDISHKELPEKWADHSSLRIEDRVLLRAIAMALRLMKRIDRKVLGPSASYLWREARSAVTLSCPHRELGTC